MQTSITIESQNKLVSVSLSLETLWIGHTVYPAVPVLRVNHRGRAVVQRSRLSFQPATGVPIQFGLEVISVKKQRPKTRFGPGRQVVIQLRERGGAKRELEITLRITVMSAFCSLKQPGKRINAGHDLSVIKFADDTVVYSGQNELPFVAHSPSAVLFAYWKHSGEHHLVMVDRPGALVEMQFGALESISEISVECGADGCRFLYTRLPFTRASLPDAVYGTAIRASFKTAYNCILAHFRSKDDDFWVIRGAPGEFAVTARRIGSKWIVCGITSVARTLTVRFEDLWLRMPAELRVLKWDVKLLRDPVNNEPGEVVEESFFGLAPDLRIALDLKLNGGFQIEFTPFG